MAHHQDTARPAAPTRHQVIACGWLGVLATGNTGNYGLGKWLLVAASLILTPLFAYMIGLRGGARRRMRRAAEARKAELDQQLTAFVTPDAIRATAGSSVPPSPTEGGSGPGAGG